LDKISVVRRSRTAAAIAVAVGAVLAASGFPATAATGTSGLASSTTGTSTTGTSTTGTSTTGTSTTGTSTTGTSTTGTSTTGSSTSNNATGATTATGDSATDSTSADTTTVATGQTLSYNEGANGYCTWWAIDEFHGYTGLYPDFFDPANDGNAGYWATDAAYDGWTVTGTPRVDSIAVFPPGVNGAESDGHVAWVTAVSGSQITISEMNGPAGWDQVDTRTLTPDSSVSYILAP
jgi:surface antigen